MVAVHAIHDLTHPILCLPWLRGPCVEVRDVVTGFVTVDIAADEAVGCDVFVGRVVLWWEIHGKELVKLVKELCFSSH